MTFQEIDIDRALELRRSGLKWREVGAKLAEEAGRKMPFRGEAVEQVFRRIKKGNLPKDKPEPKSPDYRRLYAKLRRCGFSKKRAIAECEKTK